MLTIERGGQLSTLQDGGRFGNQALGVTVGGAVDDVALNVGNWLVGNEQAVAAIEMTWLGARLRFHQDTLIALTGADSEIRCGGAAVPMWRPVWIRKGSLLCVDRVTGGARVYLCIHGGIPVEKVLGGFGTHLSSKFGGFKGRALSKDDVLNTTPQLPLYPHLLACIKSPRIDFAAPRWQLSVWRDWSIAHEQQIRLLPGIDQSHLGIAGMSALHSQGFTVQTQSDRQALKIAGPELIASNYQYQSSGMCFGVVQLPPDGKPLVLLADYQTTGGYPVIGVVASVDRCRLAQLIPGDVIKFSTITLAEAHQLLDAREKHMQSMLKNLKWQWENG